MKKRIYKAISERGEVLASISATSKDEAIEYFNHYFSLKGNHNKKKAWELSGYRIKKFEDKSPDNYDFLY